MIGEVMFASNYEVRGMDVWVPMNLGHEKYAMKKLMLRVQTMSECSYLLLVPAEDPDMTAVVTTIMHHHLPLSNPMRRMLETPLQHR
jgi:hypothetical protein